jgi:four helix bundle protein
MSYNVKKGDDGGDKFRTFEDLEVYQAARAFRKKMHGVTRQLPDFEKFELASQVRRAAVSLTNNIAEGHGRYHFADQVRFFLGSRGSLQELVVMNGYLRYLRDRKANEGPVVREDEQIATLDDSEALARLDEALSQPAPF